jgi:DNA-binding beta-propeller fold protein YncE
MRAPTIAAIRVGAGPVGLAAGEDGSVWAVSTGAGSVSRIPAGATEPDLVVPVPGSQLRATWAYDTLWVTSSRGGQLLRVDPAAGAVTERIPTGAGPAGVAAAFGSLWVVAQDAGQLLRVDPRTGSVTDRIGIGVGARLVVAGPRWLYVAHHTDGRVLRIDPATGHVWRSPEAFQGPQGMALETDHTRLWVACTAGNRVLVLDADTLDVIDRLHGPEAPDPIALTPDGTVLAVSQAGPTILTIDPVTREPVGRLALGEADQLYDQANIDAVVSGGHVWVTSFNDNVVLRTSAL